MAYEVLPAIIRRFFIQEMPPTPDVLTTDLLKLSKPVDPIELQRYELNQR